MIPYAYQQPLGGCSAHVNPHANSHFGLTMQAMQQQPVQAAALRRRIKKGRQCNATIHLSQSLPLSPALSPPPTSQLSPTLSAPSPISTLLSSAEDNGSQPSASSCSSSTPACVPSCAGSAPAGHSSTSCLCRAQQHIVLVQGSRVSPCRSSTRTVHKRDADAWQLLHTAGGWHA